MAYTLQVLALVSEETKRLSNTRGKAEICDYDPRAQLSELFFSVGSAPDGLEYRHAAYAAVGGPGHGFDVCRFLYH